MWSSRAGAGCTHKVACCSCGLGQQAYFSLLLERVPAKHEHPRTVQSKGCNLCACCTPRNGRQRRPSGRATASHRFAQPPPPPRPPRSLAAAAALELFARRLVVIPRDAGAVVNFLKNGASGVRPFLVGATWHARVRVSDAKFVCALAAARCSYPVQPHANALHACAPINTHCYQTA